MSAAEPYAVGSTVKWRDGDTEFAGIITSVHLYPDTSGTDPQEEGVRAEAFEPVYGITLSDHSIVTRHHNDLVLV